MEAKVEKLLERIVFCGVTISIVSYVFERAAYPSKLILLGSALKGEGILETGFVVFTIMCIWFATTVRSVKLRILLLIMIAWFVVVSLRAFYSFPGPDFTLVVAVVVELAVIVVYGYKTLKL